MNFTKLSSLVAMILVLCSCSSGGSDTKPNASMTLIVYMVADNSLNLDAAKDIREMEYALAKYSNNENANVIAYIDKNTADFMGVEPQIIKIEPNTDAKTIKSKTIKRYPEQISTDPTVINKVLTEIINMYPADNYGLVLWSHGSGWIKANLTSSSVTASRAFGDDNGYEINNDVLAACLPRKFNFIWFDCCLMGNIETLYEYRNKADTIIASPLEVLAGGIPYDKVIPHLLQLRCTKAAQTFFKHYAESQTDYITSTSVQPYATISVYVPSKFDALAQSIATVTANAGGYPTSPSRSAIQRMSCVSNYQDLVFDLSHSIKLLFGEDAQTSIKVAFNNAVPYEAHTPKFMDLSLVYCQGLSCYVPLRTTSSYDTYYRTLPWAKAIGWDK